MEHPGYHGVGRRDAMITDEDRRALAYFRAHPRGVRAGDLAALQRRHFDELLAMYVERVRPGLVGFEMDRIKAVGGVEALHFAWAGGTTIAEPHYFRIQGQNTLIEFDNAEDNANHVHSVWRDPRTTSAPISCCDTTLSTITPAVRARSHVGATRRATLRSEVTTRGIRERRSRRR